MMNGLFIICVCYLGFGVVFGTTFCLENNPIKLKYVETIGDILIIVFLSSSILFGYLYTMLYKIYCKTIKKILDIKIR